MKSKGARTPASNYQLTTLIEQWPRACNDNPERMTLDETREALQRALATPTNPRMRAKWRHDNP